MNIINIKQKLRKLSYIFLALPVMGGVGSGVLTSCSDWNDHYDNTGSGDNKNQTLWEEVLSNPNLSDFAEVMKAVDITRQHRKTGTTYSELLSGGRSLTLFAPVNGTFNKDSLIQLAQTNSGDSAVEKFFAQNHLISSPHSVGGTEDGKRLLLLNMKYASFSNDSINNIHITKSNIHCSNGVMHVLEKPITYKYNIYEALTNLSAFRDAAGVVLKKYNLQEFDETASTPNGTKEGMTIYADSVTKDVNKMMNALAPLTSSDSTYIVAVPSADGWNKVWAKASKAFEYPQPINKCDSLQEYYTYRALMDDAIYSMTTINKNQKDSIVSVKYIPSSWNFDPRLHVFQKPYEEGGVLYGNENIYECENGKIYSMPEWSLDPMKTYHKFIEVEGEGYNSYKMDSPQQFTSKILPKYEFMSVGGDSISKGSFVILSGTANWNTTFRLPNTLAASYDIKVILLPVSVASSSDKPYPVKFKAIINWVDENDQPQFEKITTDFISNPLKVDTITIKENFKFPACNYDMTNNKVSLTLETTVGSRETGKYTRKMYLDAIVLTPREE